MPTTVPQLIAGPIEEAVEEGVATGVRRGIGSYLHPGVAEKLGLAVGGTILIVGLAAQSRRRRQARIEQKLDTVVEQVEQLDPDDER